MSGIFVYVFLNWITCILYKRIDENFFKIFFFIIKLTCVLRNVIKIEENCLENRFYFI